MCPVRVKSIFSEQKKLAVENEILHWNPNAITDPALCKDQSPIETQPCNRTPCPGVWIEKAWTKVELVTKMSFLYIINFIELIEYSVLRRAVSVVRRCNSFA